MALLSFKLRWLEIKWLGTLAEDIVLSDFNGVVATFQDLICGSWREICNIFSLTEKSRKIRNSLDLFSGGAWESLMKVNEKGKTFLLRRISSDWVERLRVAIYEHGKC